MGNALLILKYRVSSDGEKFGITAELSNGLSISYESEMMWSLDDLDAVRASAEELLQKIWEFVNGYNELYNLMVRNSGVIKLLENKNERLRGNMADLLPWVVRSATSIREGELVAPSTGWPEAQDLLRRIRNGEFGEVLS